MFRFRAFVILFLSLFLFRGIKAQEHPNIILIVADDLGYGDIEPYGQQLIKTPNLSRLADEGILFTQFYAGTAVCAPSRSSLMEGKHTGHTFIRGNKEIQPEGQYPLPENAQTFPKALKKAGYVTGVFGKWGLGPVGSSGDPRLQGIDQFYGYNCQRQAHRYYPTHLWDNDTKVVLEENGNLEYNVTYAPDLIQKKALEFIEEHSKEQFLAMLTYNLPHAELIAPDDSILQYYKDRLPDKPFKGNDYGQGALIPGYTSQAYPHASFAAMVTRFDAYVGEVVEKVKSLGIEDNTLIVFTSDNGPHREGGADPSFFNSGGGLKGFKTELYEGGIRVPFIAKWPGRIEPKSISHFPAAFWDLFPTFTELTGASNPAGLDGMSLTPYLWGSKKTKRKGYLYWEFHEYGGSQAVRKGKWKAVRQNVMKESNTPVELYNLDKDISESTNMALKHKNKVKKMTAIMQQAHVESDIFPFLKKD